MSSWQFVNPQPCGINKYHPKGIIEIESEFGRVIVCDECVQAMADMNNENREFFGLPEPEHASSCGCKECQAAQEK